jgi:peptidoglycan/LPS O-acetylase OafA/YrhL
VTLFFVLSGFLLYRPFAAAVLRATPRPSLRRYGINRALRILPAYWVILLVVVLAFQHELLTRPLQLVANALFLQNYVPEYHVVGGWSEDFGIPPAWSLAVEVVFYVSLPLLALLAGLIAARRARHRLTGAIAPVAVLVALGIAAKLVYRQFPDELGRTWDGMGFPTHADWFAAGMALAVVRVLWEDGRLRVPRWWPLAAVTAAALLVGGSAKLWYGGTLLWTEYQALVAVALALLLTVVVLAEGRSRLVAVLEWRPLVAVGLASYSVFLWNDPIIRWMREQGLTFQGEAGFFANLFMICVVVGVASWLTYRFVEKPALARKPKSEPRALPSTEPDAFGSLESSDLRVAR